MKFTDYIKQEKPELSDIFDCLLSARTIKVIEDYADFMRITNGTGVLPKPSSNDDDKMYKVKCISCGEYYTTNVVSNHICPNCLPF